MTSDSSPRSFASGPLFGLLIAGASLLVWPLAGLPATAATAQVDRHRDRTGAGSV